MSPKNSVQLIPGQQVYPIVEGCVSRERERTNKYKEEGKQNYMQERPAKQI